MSQSSYFKSQPALSLRFSFYIYLLILGVLLELIPYELLALPTSSQVPCELLALVLRWRKSSIKVSKSNTRNANMGYTADQGFSYQVDYSQLGAKNINDVLVCINIII